MLRPRLVAVGLGKRVRRGSYVTDDYHNKAHEKHFFAVDDCGKAGREDQFRGKVRKIQYCGQ